jgi:hypothetical protein
VEARPENCALTLRKEAAKIARRNSGDDDLPELGSSERQASIFSLDGKDVINHGRVVGVALRPFRPLKTRRALRPRSSNAEAKCPMLSDQRLSRRA